MPVVRSVDERTSKTGVRRLVVVERSGNRSQPFFVPFDLEPLLIDPVSIGLTGRAGLTRGQERFIDWSGSVTMLPIDDLRFYAGQPDPADASRRYPGVDRFMEQTLDQARANGYVNTLLGRRRPVQGVRMPPRRGDKRQRIQPERIAINSVIQGSAADLIKLAMIHIHRRLKSEAWQAKTLLQIHTMSWSSNRPSRNCRVCGKWWSPKCPTCTRYRRR